MGFIALLHNQFHPIAVLIANGAAFFWGMAVVALAVVGRWWVRGFLARAVLRIAGVLGVAFVLASSTPFPSWVYVGWCLLWLAAFFVPVAGARRVIAPAFLLFSASLCLLEFPYHFTPKISVSPNQHVYVVGDSLSAGIDFQERNWPAVLGDISHLKVTNLSKSGATTSSALSQTCRITEPNALVIVELGGNDMLRNKTSDQFSKDLDRLLREIPASSHCVMFELPLIPFHHGYAQAQRALAKKYNIILIPKKYLIGVIGSDDDTLDGLHFSQKGHDALANSLLRMLAITH